MIKKTLLITIPILVIVFTVIIFYSIKEDKNITKLYEGGNFNIEKGINTPKLASGMTAIKWENSEIVEIKNPKKDSTWYDYDDGKWANAISEDGSMWVWIPRYAYQIEFGYHNNIPGVINIKFLMGTTNDTTENTPTYSDEGGSKNWNVHPAFTNTKSKLDIGWDTEIEGFWVAKFEAGRGTVSSNLKYGVDNGKANEEINMKGEIINYPVFKPNEIALNYINSNDIYAISKDLVVNNNPYGFKSSEIESLQITNAGWGAVAYLSHSKYGTDGAPIEINDTATEIDMGTAITGGEDYKVNVGESSTFNTYGVYDLVGGSWERVAGILDNRNSNIDIYISLLKKDKNTKYVDIYSVKDDDKALLNYNETKNKYGDAMYETSNSATDSNAWNKAYSLMVEKNAPVIRRGGGNQDKDKAGLFAFYITAGCETNANTSFRVVLVNKK